MMQENKKFDAYYLSGLVVILLASLISWTFFLVFLTIILYPIGIILVVLSKKKWWVKIITTVIPLCFTFPTAIAVNKFFEFLELG